MSSQPDRAGASRPGGDDGSPDPRVAAALSAYSKGAGGAADVLAALASGRLLVPVVAVLDEAAEPASPGGQRTEKSSHMATVSTTGRDGRRGLLAFTSVATMRRWNAAARPVPVTTRRAAEAALADGADALVIDLAGPVTFAVDAGELRALAAGWRPVGDGDGGMTWAVSVGLAIGPETAGESKRLPAPGALGAGPSRAAAGPAARPVVRAVAALVRRWRGARRAT